MSAPRESDVPFEVLVTELARGVADAQLELDRNTAHSVETLAATEVDVVPSVTRRIEADGTATYESADPTPRSLLELGFAPTRYRFSEATVDVDFDLELRDEATLHAGTRDLREQRKLGRTIESTATLSATLVPTPTPSHREDERA